MQRRIHSIQEPEIQIKTGKGWQQGPGRQQAEIVSKQSRTGQWQRSGVYPRVRTQGVGGKKTYTVATWRNKWQSTSVFLPGKFHGQRSLAGYSPWSCKESDTTEWLSMHIMEHNTKVTISVTSPSQWYQGWEYSRVFPREIRVASRQARNDKHTLYFPETFLNTWIRVFGDQSFLLSKEDIPLHGSYILPFGTL